MISGDGCGLSFSDICLRVGAKGDWDFLVSDLVKKKPDGPDI